MSVLIVYDSQYGNTEIIARAMAAELETTQTVRLVSVAEGNAALGGVELLIVGSPTHAFRPTPATSKFIKTLDGAALAGLPAAAFDTRLDAEAIQPAALRWVIDLAGYAAGVLHRKLAARGCAMAAEAEGFLVTGTEGPLRNGEIERARQWARALAPAAGGETDDAA